MRKTKLFQASFASFQSLKFCLGILYTKTALFKAQDRFCSASVQEGAFREKLLRKLILMLLPIIGLFKHICPAFSFKIFFPFHLEWLKITLDEF